MKASWPVYKENCEDSIQGGVICRAGYPTEDAGEEIFSEDRTVDSSVLLKGTVESTKPKLGNE